MTTILMVIHILVVAALIGVVLVQKTEGGATGMGGGANSLLTVRGTANLLTRTTAILATIFFTTTLVLALLFKGSQHQKSILQDTPDKAAVSAPAKAPEPVASAPSVPTPQGTAAKK